MLYNKTHSSKHTEDFGKETKPFDMVKSVCETLL